MKRILALSLSAALLLALLGACTGGADPENTVIPPDSAGDIASVPPTDTTQEPSLALPGEEPTEEVSEEPSAEPSQEPSVGPSQEPSQAPSAQPTLPPTSAPTSTPSAPPIVIGPGGGTEEPTDEPSEDPNGFFEPTGPSASDVDLEDFLWTIAEKYELPWGLFPTDWVANEIPGFVSIPCVQREVAMGPTIPPLNQIALIQVQNSADVAAAQAVLQAHLDQKIASDVDYNAVRWRDLSRIATKGNYVMLIVNDNCDAIVADFNALF